VRIHYPCGRFFAERAHRSRLAVNLNAHPKWYPPATSLAL
jgi:hypothetical protein